MGITKIEQPWIINGFLPFQTEGPHQGPRISKGQHKEMHTSATRNQQFKNVKH